MTNVMTCLWPEPSVLYDLHLSITWGSHGTRQTPSHTLFKERQVQGQHTERYLPHHAWVALHDLHLNHIQLCVSWKLQDLLHPTETRCGYLYWMVAVESAPPTYAASLQGCSSASGGSRIRGRDPVLCECLFVEIQQHFWLSQMTPCGCCWVLYV